MLSTEMDVLRRSARKSKMEGIKNKHIKEIMGVKEKLDIIEKKRLQWYGHVKRMPEDMRAQLIIEWVPQERRKRGRPRKTWMEGVQAAMTTRNLETDQWRNREEWRLVLRKTATAVIKTGETDGQTDRQTYKHVSNFQ